MSEEVELVGENEGAELLDIDEEIGKIKQELDNSDKEGKKEKKSRQETKKWMDNYRGKRYFQRFSENLTAKWGVFRNNWLNLTGISSLFTNILSLFTVMMLCYSMYLAVDHLKKGSDFTLIVAGAILIGVIGWINNKIGEDVSPEEDKSE